jgi:hypothetical protein
MDCIHTVHKPVYVTVWMHISIHTPKLNAPDAHNSPPFLIPVASTFFLLSDPSIPLSFPDAPTRSRGHPALLSLGVCDLMQHLFFFFPCRTHHIIQSIGFVITFLFPPHTPSQGGNMGERGKGTEPKVRPWA